MTDFRSYIIAAEKTYTYRIKTVYPMDDTFMDRLEIFLLKYKPVKIDRPKKTILQKNPVDFPNVKNAEVWMLDIELGLPAPAATTTFAEEIAAFLNINRALIVVRSATDPQGLQDDLVDSKLSFEEEAEKKHLKKIALLSLGNYEEVPSFDGADYYGKKVNEKFVSEILKVQDEKREKNKVDVSKNPLFNFVYEKPSIDNGIFNKDIKDAPKVNPKLSADGDKNLVITPEGNLDVTSFKHTKAYKDKDGKTVILTRKVDTGKK